MDLVTTYLYRSIDTNKYVKITKGFKLLETTNPSACTLKVSHKN